MNSVSLEPTQPPASHAEPLPADRDDRPCFALRGLTFGYPGRPRPVLDAIDADVPRGRRVFVVGPSGSGKSTLMYLLGLLCESPGGGAGGMAYRPRGRPEIPYESLAAAGRAELRREFGFAFQSGFLLPHLTCAENVELPLVLDGVAPAARAERIAGLFAGAELSGLADAPAAGVSGGERQRVALLRAVVRDPPVLFADEPFSALDRGNAERILNLLCDRWQPGRLFPPADPRIGGDRSADRTLLLVCHDLAVAAAYAEALLVVRTDGRLARGRTLRRDELPAGPAACAAELAALSHADGVS